MSGLRRYERDYSFASYQANAPQKPLPGQKVDQELDNLSQATDLLVDGLNDIRRSDGQLKNGIVTAETLSPELTTGLKPAVEWFSGVSYPAGATVFFGPVLYRCLKAHISGVFADDLNAGLWLEMADFGLVVSEATDAKNVAVASAATATAAADTAVAAASVATAAAGAAAASELAITEIIEAELPDPGGLDVIDGGYFDGGGWLPDHDADGGVY